MSQSNLPHYKNFKPAVDKYEPMHPNLFKVVFQLPTKLAAKYTEYIDFLPGHINTVSGLQGINPALDVVEQRFKWATRSFAGMPSTTSIDFTIEFSMNLNDANQAYTYKILRDWYRLAYDPDTGYAGLKKDYTAPQIDIYFMNREGDPYRHVKLIDSFITTAPEAMDSLDYTSADPFSASCSFRCDWFEEILT